MARSKANAPFLRPHNAGEARSEEAPSKSLRGSDEPSERAGNTVAIDALVRYFKEVQRREIEAQRMRRSIPL
jgi:hypothetical protein